MVSVNVTLLSYKGFELDQRYCKFMAEQRAATMLHKTKINAICLLISKKLLAPIICTDLSFAYTLTLASLRRKKLGVNLSSPYLPSEFIGGYWIENT